MSPAFWMLIVGSYFIGALPFGVWVAKARGVDIFAVGSGSSGATNVKRALGMKFALLVFLLDALKGALPAVAARFVVREPLGPVDAQVVWMAVGFVAVLGHCLSPFIGFKGGKGIATSLGAGLGAAPLVALAAFGVFFVVLFLSSYVSLAALVSVPTAILWVKIIPGQSRQLIVVYALLTVLLVYRHKANIVRLLNGTEPKSSWRDSKKEPSNSADSSNTSEQ